MQVLVNRAYRFQIRGGVDVRVHASRFPQTLPDGVTTDPLFALAKADGSITEIEVVEAAPIKAAVKSTK